MKFGCSSLLSTLLLSSALAQRIAIGFPVDGTSVAAGSNITVEVDRPNTLSGSTEVAIVIALHSCQNEPCLSASDILGSVLYNGPYEPTYSEGTWFKPPHQNFTVTVPSAVGPGPAQLAVFHISLIGAGPAPFTEIQNITLNIQ